MIKIDGNFGEGGGQILRSALALSIITGKPFEMYDIRKNRPSPGLKNQHLHTIECYKEMFDVKVGDAHLGSEKIVFVPGKIKKRNVEIDIGTAGSITLMLQSLMIPLVFEKKSTSLTIKGGTDVRWSMGYDYFSNVFLPQLNRISDIKMNLGQRGYYPSGNGKVEIKIKPRDNSSPKIELTEKGKLIHIRGVSHASINLEGTNVAERQSTAARNILSNMGCNISIDSRYYSSSSTGSGISLWAIFSKDEREIDMFNPIRIGSDFLGEKEFSAEDIGERCAKKLIEEMKSDAPADEHLSDNLIPFIGILKGKMKVSKITDHTRSNIYVCEKFLDIKYDIDEDKKIISVN